MSSADGWLIEGESPKQVPGLCREKTAPETGEGRAYTQNPATAQAAAQAATRGFRLSRPVPDFRSSQTVLVAVAAGDRGGGAAKGSTSA